MTADVEPVFLHVPRHEVAYVKFVFESYEGVAVTRTVDRHAAVLAVLAAPDFLPQVHAIVAALGAEIGCRTVPRPPGVIDLLADDPNVR